MYQHLYCAVKSRQTQPCKLGAIECPLALLSELTAKLSWELEVYFYQRLLQYEFLNRVRGAITAASPVQHSYLSLGL